MPHINDMLHGATILLNGKIFICMLTYFGCCSGAYVSYECLKPYVILIQYCILCCKANVSSILVSLPHGKSQTRHRSDKYIVGVFLRCIHSNTACSF